MSTRANAPAMVPIGPAPRLQQNWDARAAANFVLGGAGSGLIAFTVLAGAQSHPAALLLLAGLALVGTGLTSVWLEIGRPRRAMHVFFNARTSWMSREAVVATALVPVTLAAALGIDACRAPAAALAVAFVCCQACMLQRARGIPTWREPLVVPLIIATGLVEGGGLFFAAEPWHAQGTRGALVLLGGLVLARVALWLPYRRRVARTAAAAALAALDGAGTVLQFGGSLLPLLAIGVVAANGVSGPAAAATAALAGVFAAAAGAWLKWTLVRRAAYLQGFALPDWPVRGTRR